MSLQGADYNFQQQASLLECFLSSQSVCREDIYRQIVVQQSICPPLRITSDQDNVDRPEVRNYASPEKTPFSGTEKFAWFHKGLGVNTHP